MQFEFVADQTETGDGWYVDGVVVKGLRISRRGAVQMQLDGGHVNVLWSRRGQLDIVAAFQTGNYLHGPYAVRMIDVAFAEER